MACADGQRYVVVELEGMRQVVISAGALDRRAGVVDLRIETSQRIRVGERLAEGVVGLELESVSRALAHFELQPVVVRGALVGHHHPVEQIRVGEQAETESWIRS